MITRHCLPIVRQPTFNGFADLLEIARAKRAGFLYGPAFAQLVRAFISSRMTARGSGTGNKARRRRGKLEIARETRVPVGDVIHDTLTEGLARQPRRVNFHE